MRIAQLTVVAAFAAACSSAEKKEAMAPMPPNELAISGVDFAFTAPDTVPAGVTHVTFENKGQNLHHVQFVKLDSGKTLADLLATMKNPGPPPAWAMFVSGPNAPNPGGMSNETIDLAAGNYAIICLVDIPGGVPHLMKGMARALTVKPGDGMVAATDSADVHVELADYSFKLSRPLTAGKHVIEVTSHGPQPHEVEIIQLASGKTIDDFGKWIMKPDGPPPASALGGTSAGMPGMDARFTVTLTPGNYAIVCLIPDAKDGKPHIAHGMVQNFTIE